MERWKQCLDVYWEAKGLGRTYSCLESLGFRHLNHWMGELTVGQWRFSKTSGLIKKSSLSWRRHISMFSICRTDYRRRELARHELSNAQSRFKQYHDIKAPDRQLKPGDKVLLLLPTDHKLLMQWKSPHEVGEAYGGITTMSSFQTELRCSMRTCWSMERYVKRHVTHVEELETLGAAVINSENDDSKSGFEFSSQQKETHMDVQVNPE